ncbi:unnamed protein product [Vitrella brassicaformis CCMP3155]|uniref:Uncharacterized protein n=1 Tax=Vitrella brassicaformis (strain CCMP3155) TaxID=1169540 RepID=A0A0G4ER21_VITBC|nr:unnamed protein product [Vitrella brassicaformis CCMP3155]|mmetsp:Transcript_3843/g.8777  ORF Transcript_3843/g.8777 Transcript_3843/m.8777 type:complete len:81 (+) Transcript_3843:195-437(+)|eukprot:CEL99929.1 unnamed protein product [Vitrella brassicaformis CCMP3155]
MCNGVYRTAPGGGSCGNESAHWAFAQHRVPRAVVFHRRVLRPFIIKRNTLLHSSDLLHDDGAAASTRRRNAGQQQQQQQQ